MKRPIPSRWRVLILIAFLQSATYLGQCAGPEAQPADVVQNLYREVVAHHPWGVPHGAAKSAIWPLLSERLIKAFETRDACDRDWAQRHRNANPPVKAPGFYEDGLFSGSNEQGYISGAKIGSTKAQSDGSYLVHVHVWSYLGTSKIYRWQVAARVISEDGKFVVDDILGPKGTFDYDKSVYMSKMLTIGCKGTRSTFN